MLKQLNPPQYILDKHHPLFYINIRVFMINQLNKEIADENFA
jgi:hypothetical protein